LAPAIWFWIGMFLWLIFGLYLGFRPNGDRWLAGSNVLLFLLFALVGWAVFGGPVR
jgi:hypothetical protein